MGVSEKSFWDTPQCVRGWWHFDTTTAGAMFHSRYLLRRKAMFVGVSSGKCGFTTISP